MRFSAIDCLRRDRMGCRRATSAWGRSLLGLAILVTACARTLPPPAPAPGVEPPVEAPAGETAAGLPAAVEPATGEEAATPPAAGTPPAGPPGALPPPDAASAASPAPLESPASEAPLAPRRLRVGLATDLASLTLPCCGEGLVAEAAGERVAVALPLRIEPRAEITRPGAYRLQAAALKDERQAKGLAARLGEEMAAPADVVFDAGIDLYRVRVGRFASREEAEGAVSRLRALGMPEAWVVSEPGHFGETALEIRQGERAIRVPGRWLTLRPTGLDWTPYNGKRYRGSLLVYLNDRGTLNLINEVDLEDYLRGVVPREMGPEIFDNLDALKAQAVAARTYTLKNLGEFVREGYDICATPRCQVYDGVGVEHRLTDQAIAETAGEVVVFQGELIDALYSSTCGGHTEDVQVVFPQKNEPYLKGVACLEAGVEQLAGIQARGASFAEELTGALLPAAGAGRSPETVAARFEHLALLAGLPVPGDRLASLDRRELQRYIASVFDLALEARLFVAPEDVPYLLDERPRGWSEDDLRLAAYLMKSGLLKGDLDRPLTDREIDETLLQMALFLRVIEEVPARHLRLAGGVLEVRAGGEARRFELPPRLATFRQRSGERSAATLSLLAGDRLTLYHHDGELLAAVQDVDLDGVAFDRTSNYSSWKRFRSDADLEALVNARYPGLGFAGLSLLSRGISGRVGAIRLTGPSGREEEVHGLAVRWTLDLPDTLFTAKRLQPSGGEPGWLFTGRGWGHGVGLCQVGAYGMAVRGHSYQEILRHYYSGVELVRVRWRDSG